MERLKKRNNYTLSAEAQKIVDAIPKNKSRWVSEAIVQYAPCNHEMVVCDANGRIPITGEPFRGASYAICHKCGYRPNIKSTL